MFCLKQALVRMGQQENGQVASVMLLCITVPVVHDLHLQDKNLQPSDLVGQPHNDIRIHVFRLKGHVSG